MSLRLVDRFDSGGSIQSFCVVRTIRANPSAMRLRVRSITYLAEAVNGYELVDPRGRDLPRFAAGAHINMRPGRLLRQCWLCNDPAERRRYCIALLREEQSRGGSDGPHDTIRVGDLLDVSFPRGDFRLALEAERHLLIAGGIGIVPIMAMIADLQRRGADFQLHYWTGSPEKTAFRDTLAPLAGEGRASFHYGSGYEVRGSDVVSLLRDPSPGTHLYICAPSPLMVAALEAARGWPPGTVHSEYFIRSTVAGREEDRPFRVRLAKRGVAYDVPAGDTIVNVLRRHGVAVTTSCELGYCGACLTRYLAGEPDHRDQMLGEKDRACYVLICCARAKTPVLVLDL